MQAGRGRGGARKDGVWEGGSKVRVGRERGIEGIEGGSDDARQGESISGGREG